MVDVQPGLVVPAHLMTPLWAHSHYLSAVPVILISCTSSVCGTNSNLFRSLGPTKYLILVPAQLSLDNNQPALVRNRCCPIPACNNKEGVIVYTI
jgi:hypothetical protein